MYEVPYSRLKELAEAEAERDRLREAADELLAVYEQSGLDSTGWLRSYMEALRDAQQ